MSQYHLVTSMMLTALAVCGQGVLSIEQNRECFFDNYLLDKGRTTAELMVHHPIVRETVLKHDEPWEGSGCDYHNFFFDETYAGFD